MWDLQSGIDRFAFQSQYSEDALMRPAQWLLANEALQRLDAQSKLAASKRAFCPHRSRFQAFKVPWQQVLRSVDNPQDIPDRGT